MNRILELSELARMFLLEHPEFNEVELSDGEFSVRVIRHSPSPIAYQTNWPPVAWLPTPSWKPTPSTYYTPETTG